MLDKFKDTTSEDIGPKNLTPSTYYPFSNKDSSYKRSFDLKAIVGQLVSYISETKVSKNYSYDDFKEKCLTSFQNELSDPNAVSILKDVFFSSDDPQLFSLLMFQAYKAELKDEKVFSVFKLMMKQDDCNISFSTKLNFLESYIVKEFEEELISSPHNDQSVSYLPFLDTLFTKDVDFLSKKSHYFTQHAEQFLELYLFLYTSQLALNVHPHTFEEPKSRPLYFILNYEKASIERKQIRYEGYRNLYDHARYLFPYLSFLETLIKITNNPKLRLYDISTQLNDDKETVDTLSRFEVNFRLARKLDPQLVNHSTLDDVLSSLLNSVFSQFQDKSTRKDVFEKYNRAFENQSAKPFLHSRGRFGKVLVLDQDMILLITNMAVGEKSQVRFQDLIIEFNKRGIYFDSKSKNTLIELYERVGNIDRKSDSGDAVYVKSTI
ncbi:MAG: DNA phosphorothioation-dependent restriction protein DptG [Sulfurovum sp.]|nr:DNA phosphorothioation-dependent restriction protein DptG [Sulfurovum sp.]